MMQDRFAYDTHFSVASAHVYYRCSEAGAHYGRWAVRSANALTWIPDQVIEVNANKATLITELPNGKLGQVSMGAAEALIVASALGLPLRVEEMLFSVSSLGQASKDVELALPDGSAVTSGQWLRDAHGGHARFVRAERADAAIVVIVDAGRGQVEVPASTYQLRAR